MFPSWFSSAAGCPKPPDILNGGIIIPASTGVNSVVQYYCNPGFQLTGRANRTCQSDSTWEGDEPWCEKGGSGKRFDLHISVRHETDTNYRYFAMLRFIFCWLGICFSEIHAKTAKNYHLSECTGKQNINWISPLLRYHSHCKENHTIFSRPLKFQNTFLKWPCFYSRHCLAETLSIRRETPLIQSIIDLTEACGPPPHVERAFHDSEGIVRFPSGSQVQYRCQEGFMLTERHANTRALCIHQRWEGLRMSCKRQSTSQFK